MAEILLASCLLKTNPEPHIMRKQDRTKLNEVIIISNWWFFRVLDHEDHRA